MLDTKTMRWSSPACFKDPMLPNHNTVLPFTRDAMLKSAIRLSSAMIFGPDSPKGDSPLINAIKRWREDGRFGSPEEAENVLGELLTRLIDQRFENLEGLIQQWQIYIRKLRIACFYTKPDNLLAWQYSAQQHEGVVFSFNIGPQLMVSTPKPVEYSVTSVEITTLKEQIAAILHNAKETTPDRFEKMLLIKPQQYKFAQEWRCFRETNKPQTSDAPATWFDDIPFKENDLFSVCFGIATSEQDKSDLKKLLKTQFPSAKCYQAEIAKGKYELDIVKF